ncbi:uncharacterized protein DEA37_0008373 [Paragonimus westermani]|uniref:UBC core domain-containing protein n=1 Tax=Paragonimus westermani TaxID=34504 RepID=A0A5J4NMG4_9TREM|nr:uncharacterized protein DEA37_0008373 [Paragonimus westermani]
MMYNKINVPEDYPNKPPAVSCLTPVFHPNIDAVRHLDNVCLNITDCWNRSFGLKSFLQALLFLFYEPNFEDPIDSFTSALPEGASFEHCVHLSLMGGTINSVTYEINQSWCKWAEENGFSPAPPIKPEQTEDAATILPSTVERQISTTSAYFQRVVSGQFDSSPLPSLSQSEVESNSLSVNDFYPLACLRQITVEQLNLANDLDQVPWMKFSRYYFGEETTDHYNYVLADYIDSSFFYLTPPLMGKSLQRSDVQRWRLSSDFYAWGLLSDVLGERPVVSRILDFEASQLALDPDTLADCDRSIQDSASVNSQALDRPISQNPPDSTMSTDQGSRANSMIIDNRPDYLRSSLPNDTDHALLDDALSGVRNTGQDEQGSLSFNGEGSVANMVSEVTGLGTGANQISTDLRGNQLTDKATVPSDHICPKTNGDHSFDTNDVSRDVSVEAIDAQDFSPADLLVDFAEVTDDDVNHRNSGDCWEPFVESEFRPESNELISRLFIFTYPFFVHLQPLSWLLYQSRWPPFLAPGRLTMLTREEKFFRFHRICRASSIQLRLDLNQYAASSSFSPISLILADPLALSPFSPILNRVITVKNPSVSQFQEPILVTYLSIEWLSLTGALFDRAPPVTELGTRRAPGSALLACLCWLSNWVAYFSRLELYGLSLGYSRPRLTWLIKSVGDVCILPATLGCGQTPLLDAWPLFLLRQTFRWSSALLVYLATSLSSGDPTFQSCRLRFPFSDLDEI